MTKPHAPSPPPLDKQNSWSPDMISPHAPPPLPLCKQKSWSPDMISPRAPPPRPLCKQKSWSPDTLRDETWRRKRSNSDARRLDRSRSVSDDDLDELKACIELGFGFDSPVVDPKLSDTLPALEFYHAVNTQCSKSVITDGGDDEEVKTRLRQWAQLVACSVRQSSSSI